MKTLAIDFGEKFYGLAVSDTKARFAKPIDTIITRNQQKAIEEIVETLADLQIERILIGLPLGNNDKPTQKSQEVEEFIQQLVTVTPLPIIRWNEVLTSQQAQQNIKNKRYIHSEAARIMLQEFLDHEQITKTTTEK